MLGTDQGKISHIESGRIGVSEERIRKLAAFYHCTDERLLGALCAMARERRGQFWWDAYRGTVSTHYVDIAEMEHHATGMHSLQIVTVPAVLQTEDYMRALFRGSLWPLTDDQVDRFTEFRMRRKVIFDRDDPPRLEAFVHETALRMRFGGRKVARGQLGHLMEISRQPYVGLRVVPFTNEKFYDMTRPVLYASGVVNQLDTVTLDGPLGHHTLYAEVELAAYWALFEHAAKVSLDYEESRLLIHHIAREL